jgi:hypothetical protein
VGYRDQLIGEFMSDLLGIWLELDCGVFPEPRFWTVSVWRTAQAPELPKSDGYTVNTSNSNVTQHNRP